MTRTRSRSIVGALAVGLSLAACGGSSPSSNTTGSATSATDPASAIPAAAVLYAQAVVRPTGTLAAGIDAGAKKLVGIANPGAMIDAAIDSAIKPRHVSYEATIRPWLGQRAAVALLGGTAAKPQFALVADQTNAALARKALFGLVRSAAANGAAAAVVSGSYRGVSYLAKPDGSAAVAVAGPFAIVGTLGGMRQVIDVEHGAAALSAASDYEAATVHTIDSAAVTAFIRTRQLFTLLVSSGSATASASALLDKLIPANLTVLASARLDAGGLTVDVATPANGPSGGTGPSKLFAALPGGSWLALGESGVGAALAKAFTLLADVASGAGGTSGAILKRCTTSPAGKATCTTVTQTTTSTSSALTASPATTAIISAYTKVLRQISDLALFVKGTQLTSIEGGLEIATTSPSAATSLFGELKGLLGSLSSTQVRIGPLSAAGIDRGFTATVPGVPFGFDIAQKGNMLLGTVGNGALADALSTTNRLGDSATATLLGSGVRPVLELSLPALAKLLKNLGVSSDATVAQIVPYLDSLGTVAVGQSVSGGYVIERIAIG
jgi:hypothetical protein